MRRFRGAFSRACVAACAALLIGVAAGPAAAATRPPTGYPTDLTQHVDSPHFVVHYTTDTTTTAVATALSGYAERAYARLVTEWGYPAPLNDGDGRTDIYMFDFGIGPAAGPDSNTADQTTGVIVMPPANAGGVYPVAHEFFHVIQFGIYHREQGWLDESTAEWAGQNVVVAEGGSAPPNWYYRTGVSLDCDTGCADGTNHRASIFMEYLDEHYGMDIVHDVYQHAAVLGSGNHQQHSLQALSDVLVDHGTTLADTMNDFVVAATAGWINRPGVTNYRPETQHQFTVGQGIGAFPTIPITIDHLAFKSAWITAQDGAACEPRTLQISVGLPSGVPTRPTFVIWPGIAAESVKPLTIGGSTAYLELPWSTCKSTQGTLVMANGSSTANGQVFPVTVALAPAAAPSITPPVPGPPIATPSNRFRLTAKAGAKGKIAVTVVAQAAGDVWVKGTTIRHKRKVTYGTNSAGVRAGRKVTLTITPWTAAKKLLNKTKKLRVTLRVTFSPIGGTARTSTKTVTVKAPRVRR